MLICNAVLTDADGARPGDVRIENGVITAVGEGLSIGGDTVLDAQAVARCCLLSLTCTATSVRRALSIRRISTPAAGRLPGAVTRSSTAWRTQGLCVLPRPLPRASWTTPGASACAT